jgi:hypothetical protein
VEAVEMESVELGQIGMEIDWEEVSWWAVASLSNSGEISMLRYEFLKFNQ